MPLRLLDKTETQAPYSFRLATKNVPLKDWGASLETPCDVTSILWYVYTNFHILETIIIFRNHQHALVRHMLSGKLLGSIH